MNYKKCTFIFDETMSEPSFDFEPGVFLWKSRQVDAKV
jgi:hypothetical protein